MAHGPDPTFYRSPAAAIAAPPEELAYVAALDPAGAQPDAITVVDCHAESSSYGQVVGWAELPTAGNELHHFGWNACSSALCHEGHAHNGGLERRYLLVPGSVPRTRTCSILSPTRGTRSSRTRSRPTSLPPRQGIRARTPFIADPAASSFRRSVARTAPTVPEASR